MIAQNNCVATGLVSRPEHMPDRVFDFDLGKSECIVVKQPKLSFAKRGELVVDCPTNRDQGS